MFRLLVTLALFLIPLAAPATAGAVPGQCVNSPWGGFCDGPANPNGTFYHCEYFGLWNRFQNCYNACLNQQGQPYPC